MHVCRFACSTHRFRGVESGPSFRVPSKTLRKLTRFETYCRNLHIDVHVPFRGFTLVRCKPGAAYQGLVPESMFVFKWQGLVSYFATRMHACRFSYSTHRFGDIESGPSISNVSKVDKLSNILSKSVNLRAGSGAASPGMTQTLMHYLFGRCVWHNALLETAWCLLRV